MQEVEELGYVLGRSAGSLSSKRTGFVAALIPMSQGDATDIIESELKRPKRPDNYPVTGFAYKGALPFKDNWNSLPAQISD